MTPYLKTRVYHHRQLIAQAAQEGMTEGEVLDRGHLGGGHVALLREGGLDVGAGRVGEAEADGVGCCGLHTDHPVAAPGVDGRIHGAQVVVQ